MASGRPCVFDADDRQKCVTLFQSGLTRIQVRDKMNEDRCELCSGYVGDRQNFPGEARLAIPTSLLDTLYYSMDDRMDVVRFKNGYPTHY